MKDLAKDIKSKIESGDLKMKPKAYFAIGGFLASAGVIVFGILSTFFANIMIHRVRIGRLFPEIGRAPAGGRLKMFVTLFPWEVFALAVVSLALGLYLIKKFDVSYKKSFSFLVSLLVAVVILTAVTIDRSGINERFKKHPPLKRFYGRQEVLGKKDLNRNPRNNFERKQPPRLY